MRVEECCQELLAATLPKIDLQRSGVAIDVGVGEFSFFCETFAKLGFRTIAVEPIPVASLRKMCARRKINLITSVLSDVDGEIPLYLGTYEGQDNTNLNSLHPDWWGSSTISKQVPSMTLARLYATCDVREVTCLKLDVEGAEQSILSQFEAQPDVLLPKVLMFEYGGGGERREGVGGWRPEYLDATMNCLAVLQRSGYEEVIILDAALPQERTVNLQQTALSVDEFFNSQAVYGNMIAFRGFQPERALIAKICHRYAREAPNPSRLRRLVERAKRSLGRI